MIASRCTVREPRAVYTLREFGLERQALEALQRLQPHRTILSTLAVGLQCFGLAKAAFYLEAHYAPYAYLAYPCFVLLIAGRLGAFLQIIHEAAHHLVSRNPAVNDFVGNWLASYPIGLTLAGYANGHKMHHAYTNQELDPESDREKYRVCDLGDPRLWGLFLKDLLGWTAIQVLRAYQKNLEKQGATAGDPPPRYPWRTLRAFASITFVQAVFLFGFFNGSIPHYIALWIVPAVSGHMVLVRVRGIAEHGLGVQLASLRLQERGIGTFYTRSLLTPANRYRIAPLNWIEKLLIGSLNVHYHHEHHLLPTVPYYHLPKLHALVADRVGASNSYTYAKGYFSCLFVRAAS